MNYLKRSLGILWILLGAALLGYFPYKTYNVLTSSVATSEDFVFWIVVTVIFIPVILGLLLFGYYAVKGEYDEPTGVVPVSVPGAVKAESIS